MSSIDFCIFIFVLPLVGLISCLSGFRACDLAKGRMSLGVVFEVSPPHSLCFLPVVKTAVPLQCNGPKPLKPCAKTNPSCLEVFGYFVIATRSLTNLGPFVLVLGKDFLQEEQCG